MPLANRRMKQLINRRNDLMRQLSPQKEMLRGSLVRKKINCGKNRCRCQQGQLHQAFYLSYSQDAKTKTVCIPAELVPEVKAAIKQYKKHKQLVDKILGTNLCVLQEKKRINKKSPK